MSFTEYSLNLSIQCVLLQSARFCILPNLHPCISCLFNMSLPYCFRSFAAWSARLLLE